MKMKRCVVALALLQILLVACTVLADERTLQIPPQSLADWYKPVNKRQVWLHTMFNLRREMQAVSEYAVLEDRERVKKWAGRLVGHYRKIGEMVPEWNDELELQWADRLLYAAEQGDFAGIARAQRKIAGSCRACHREYRAVSAAIYRTPDYKALRVESGQTLEEEPFSDVMERLSTLVNRIKIANEDQRQSVALESLNDLSLRLADLANICSECHQDPLPGERILGAASHGLIQALKTSLEQQDQTASGKNLGSLAVEVCARCHGVHRTLFDLQQAVVD